MTEYPITFSEFKNWLETKSPTEIVGRRLFPALRLESEVVRG